MKTLALFWLIFVVLFGVLAYFHFRASRNRITQFNVSERAYNKEPGIKTEAKISGTDIDEPLKNFVTDFNLYIENYNKTSYQQNILAAVGYLAAAFTALISMVLTVGKF